MRFIFFLSKSNQTDPNEVIVTESADGRGEHFGSGGSVAINTKRQRFVLRVRDAGGRNLGPLRPQLARVLRHLHPNPRLLETLRRRLGWCARPD